MLSEINICSGFVYTDIKVVYIWGWIVMGPLTTWEAALLEPRERAYLTLNTSSLTSVFWHQIWLVSQWLQANADVMNTRGPAGSHGMQMPGASRHLGAGRLVLEEIKVLSLSMQKNTRHLAVLWNALRYVQQNTFDVRDVVNQRPHENFWVLIAWT